MAPRVPYLIRLDFFLWEHLKSLVYTSTTPDNLNDLRNRIIQGFETIQNTPGIFKRVRTSMRRRMETCVMVLFNNFCKKNLMLFLVIFFVCILPLLIIKH